MANLVHTFTFIKYFVIFNIGLWLVSGQDDLFLPQISSYSLKANITYSDLVFSFSTDVENKLVYILELHYPSQYKLSQELSYFKAHSELASRLGPNFIS